ncbi:lysozyme C-like [Stegodyphus dumicola]|uniref:lysozyme C-like n=1 Tax=Stegodyphus dumicola TaxID=202533 RepID=UPI0015AAFDE2|nr:lysozyme C-like [Stegodyphus dumicola]
MIHRAVVAFLLFVLAESKVFDRCELGRELYEKFSFPLEDISKWLCLVHWESGFDTTAVNKGATENSLDYGLFQINDKNWCKGPLRPSENQCRIPCERLKDDDLSDDIQCVRTIIQKKGFYEWMSYGLRCNSNTEEYFKNCDLTSRALNVGMKVRLEPKPSVRFNVNHIKDAPNFAKIRIGLTSQPKGVKVNVNAKEAKLNFFSKYLGAYFRMKPFFTLHQYVTR